MRWSVEGTWGGKSNVSPVHNTLFHINRNSSFWHVTVPKWLGYTYFWSIYGHKSLCHFVNNIAKSTKFANYKRSFISLLTAYHLNVTLLKIAVWLSIKVFSSTSFLKGVPLFNWVLSKHFWDKVFLLTVLYSGHIHLLRIRKECYCNQQFICSSRLKL